MPVYGWTVNTNDNMSFSLCFWILMLLWLVSGIGISWSLKDWKQHAPYIVLFLLLMLLGWKVFGPPIHG